MTWKQFGCKCLIFLSGAFIAWVPGLVYGALKSPNYPQPAFLGVGLIWWSVWLSFAWVDIWICSLLSVVGATALRKLLGGFSLMFNRARCMLAGAFY